MILLKKNKITSKYITTFLILFFLLNISIAEENVIYFEDDPYNDNIEDLEQKEKDLLDGITKELKMVNQEEDIDNFNEESNGGPSYQRP